jgi:uncharacterized delta-60 repeat protein
MSSAIPIHRRSPRLALAVLLLLAAATAGAAARRGGEPDLQFGVAGITRTQFPGSLRVTGLARQPDGKLIAGCWLWRGAEHQDTPQFGLVRYTPDGELDSSFGESGTVRVDLGENSGEPLAAWCQSVRIDAQGRILAAGGVYDPPNSLTALVRCHADGSLDDSFGEGGKVVTFAGPSAEWNDVVALGDGGVLAAGTGSASGERDVMLARFDSLGRPDADFGNGGRVVTPLDAASAATGVAVRANGSIVACGLAGLDACLLQYRPDGTLDPAFGSGGKVLLDIQRGEDRFEQLVLARDGKVVVAGGTSVYSENGWTDYPILARFTAAGKLDRGFGRRGSFRGAAGEVFTDLALQRDDRIVTTGPASDEFSLFRFTRAGVPDHSFGTRGVVTGIAAGVGASGAVLVEPSGKLIAAGYARSGSGSDLLITRRLPR